MNHGSASYLASLFPSQLLVELMRGEDERKKEVTLLEALELAIIPGPGAKREENDPRANLPMG